MYQSTTNLRPTTLFTESLLRFALHNILPFLIFTALIIAGSTILVFSYHFSKPVPPSLILTFTIIFVLLISLTVVIHLIIRLRKLKRKALNTDTAEAQITQSINRFPISTASEHWSGEPYGSRGIGEKQTQDSAPILATQNTMPRGWHSEPTLPHRRPSMHLDLNKPLPSNPQQGQVPGSLSTEFPPFNASKSLPQITIASQSPESGPQRPEQAHLPIARKPSSTASMTLHNAPQVPYVSAPPRMPSLPRSLRPGSWPSPMSERRAQSEFRFSEVIPQCSNSDTSSESKNTQVSRPSTIFEEGGGKEEMVDHSVKESEGNEVQRWEEGVSKGGWNGIAEWMGAEETSLTKGR